MREDTDEVSTRTVFKMDAVRDWNPMETDYLDPSFNRYSEGPGADLPSGVGSKKVSLYVNYIPMELTENGLKNLFSRAGHVLSAVVKNPKYGNDFSYGFVEFGSAGDAATAIEKFNNFKVGEKKLMVRMALSPEESQRRAKQREKDEQIIRELLEQNNMASVAPVKENKQQLLNGAGDARTLAVPKAPGGRGGVLQALAMNSSARTPGQAEEASQNSGVPVTSVPTGQAVVENGRGAKQAPKPTRPAKARDPSKARPCVYCEKPAYNQCARCKFPYCSVDCQKTDWPRHKVECNISLLTPEEFAERFEITIDEEEVDEVAQMLGAVSQVKKQQAQLPQGPQTDRKAKIIELPPAVPPSQGQPPASSNPISPSRPFLKADRIPAKACDLEDVELPIKVKVEVIISHVVSPGEIWVQKITDELNQLTVVNEKIYRSDAGGPVSAPAVGELYGAEFQGEWFRAKVCKILSGGKARVMYVDYGNDAVVPTQSLRHLPDSVIRYPKQGILCSLANVIPADAKQGWPADIQGAMQHLVTARKYNCTALQKLADRFQVSLRSSDGDLGEILARQGLVLHQKPNGDSSKLLKSPQRPQSGLEASPQKPSAARAQPKREQSKNSSAALMRPLKMEELPWDISVEVVIAHMESWEEIFVQKMQNKSALASVMREISQFVQSSSGSVGSPQEGMLCGALFPADKMYYRARVVHIVDKTHVEVLFVDFGNRLVAPNSQLRTLPERMFQLPAQGIRCRLAGVKPVDPTVGWPEVTDNMLKIMEKEMYLCKVVDKAKDLYHVTLTYASSDSSQLNGKSVADLLVFSGDAKHDDSSPKGKSPSPRKWPGRGSPGQPSPQQPEPARSRPPLLENPRPEHPRLTMHPAARVPHQRPAFQQPQKPNPKEMKQPQPEEVQEPRGQLQQARQQLSKQQQQQQQQTKQYQPKQQPKQQLPQPQKPKQQQSSPARPQQEEPSLQARESAREEVHMSASAIEKSKLVVGEKQQVAVQFVESPTAIWVWRVEPESIQLMLETSEKLGKYCGGAPPLSQVPRVGSLCAAFFPEDETWYRAQVLEHPRPQQAKVFYMDFGNLQVIQLKDIRALPQEMSTLPAQAICCRLRGLAPPQDSWAADVNTQLSALCTEGLMTADVTAESDGVYELDLVAQGAECSVSEAMVRKGLAVRREKGQAATTPPKPCPAPRGPCRLRRTDLRSGMADLEVGQEVKVLPVDCLSPLHIVVQVLNQERYPAFLEMSSDIANAELDSQPSYIPVEEGELVMGKFEGLWYRAEVLSLTGSDARLVYVDYGNEDTVPLASLRAMEPKWAAVPAQGLLCHLQGLALPSSGRWPQEVLAVIVQSLAQEPENPKVFSCLIKETKEDSMGIDLILDNGHHLVDDVLEVMAQTQGSSSSSPEGVSPSPSPGVVSPSPTPGVVSPSPRPRVVSPSPNPAVVSPSPSPAVVSPSPSPARISPSPSPAVVSSSPSPGGACPSPSGSRSSGGEPGSDAGSASSKAPALVSQVPASPMAASPAPGSPVVLQPSILPVDGSRLPAKVIAISSFDDFFIQLADAESKIEPMMKILNQICAESQPASEVRVGESVAALFPEDQRWYRAQVLAAADEQYLVLYVDYGNKATVAVEKLQRLPPECCQLPMQGVPCSLAHVQGTEAQLLEFAQLSLDQTLLVDAVSYSEGKYAVRMRVPGTGLCLNNLFAPGGGAAPATPPPVASPASETGARLSDLAIFLPSSLKFEALVISVRSPSLLYCQFLLRELALEMQELSEKLEAHCESAQVPDNFCPQPGLICGAKFSQDQVWYRCVVEEARPDECQVFFMDYGNVEVISNSELRPLSPELQSWRVLAFKAAVSGLQPKGREWSSSAVEVVQALENRSVKMEVCGVEEATDTLLVKTQVAGEFLGSTDMDIGEVLLQYDLADKPLSGMKSLEEVQQQFEALRSKMAARAPKH